jgi:hypothetical protein
MATGNHKPQIRFQSSVPDGELDQFIREFEATFCAAPLRDKEKRCHTLKSVDLVAEGMHPVLP